MLAHLASLPWLQIITSLLIISEGLALMPGIPANGVLDGAIRLLSLLKQKLSK